MSALDGLLATGWAISAGERYRVGDTSIVEVQAACDAAYGAYYELTDQQRPYAEPALFMEPASLAAYRAAMFAFAVAHQLPGSMIEARLLNARDAFKAAYP